MLLPGDPGRALRLAQQLIEGPRMLNHNRGLWGYSGPAADGRPLTIQATGIGGPSAAAVVEELIALGARRLVRVGTCRALGDLALGALVVADRALPFDGASRALGAGEPPAPDARLLRALARTAGPQSTTGAVATVDLFYGPVDPAWQKAGAVAVDLESATILALARHHGVAAACLLVVAGRPGGERIGDEALLEAEQQLGSAAAAALGAA